jgi:hypothetical protein
LTWRQLDALHHRSFAELAPPKGRRSRDGRPTSRALTRCAVLALVALAGCSRTPPSDQSHGAATTAASATGAPAVGATSGDAYSDCAAAVAPAYTNNVKSSGGTKDQSYEVYQINTGDSYKTVLA